MSKDAKFLRSQLRQLMPDVLSTELVATVEKEVQRKVNLRLDAIEKHLKAVLSKIQEDQKDVASFLIRSATPKAPEVKSIDGECKDV